MTTSLSRYPLDITGVDVNNLVTNEVHSLSNNAVRAIAPMYGAYFAESVKLFDITLNKDLILGIDFVCSELLQTPTELYGKEISYLIVIINPQISSNVTVTYQVLGGLYSKPGDAIIGLYESFKSGGDALQWINILNKPATFAPSQHMHDGRDIYGFEYLVNSLERVRTAIALKDIPAYEGIMNWLTGELTTVNGLIDSKIAALNDATNKKFSSLTDTVSSGGNSLDVHIADKSNPHDTTKAQTGLGNVENLELSSALDITALLALQLTSVDADVPTDKYVSLRRLLQFKNSIVNLINAANTSSSNADNIISGTIDNARLANSVQAGSGTKITYNSKGIITKGEALSSSDVTNALGFTPSNTTMFNPGGLAEIGRYIDMHVGAVLVDGTNTVNGALDYDIRLETTIGINQNTGAPTTGGGTLLVHAAGGIISDGDIGGVSDERLKRNWRDICSDFISKWSKVKHGIYDRVDTGITQLGVSAQSAQEVIPESVREGVDSYLSFNYAAAACVATIKLAERAEQLSADNKMLLDIIAKLEKRVSSLENKNVRF